MIDFKKLKQNGAVTLDVRSAGEFAAGHIADAKNIPLDVLNSKIQDIKSWDKPVITCCRSGGRSKMAANYLSSQGVDVYDGGGWQDLKTKI